MFCITNRVVDGRYQIVTTIGNGGTSAVYLVVDMELNRQLALKTLSHHLERQISWGRFEREARNASRMNHPNIVRVYDFGLINGKVPYLVMELVHGQTLHERIQRSGPLTAPETFAVFKAIASALLYAHQLNIIHRDIKPANIILTTDMHGEITGAKLIDFGLSKNLGGNEFAQSLTATGEVFGSPFYMSPEQWNNDPVHVGSDLYSLGITLFEALSATVPYHGENAFATATLHNTAPIPSLGAQKYHPANFQNWDLILQKLLAKLPEGRYLDAGELSEDLNRLAQGQPIQKNYKRTTAVPCNQSRVDKAIWVAIAIVFLALTFVCTLMLHYLPGNSEKHKITVSHNPNYVEKCLADPQASVLGC